MLVPVDEKQFYPEDVSKRSELVVYLDLSIKYNMLLYAYYPQVIENKIRQSQWCNYEQTRELSIALSLTTSLLEENRVIGK